MKLDYTLETPEQRLELVQQILSENPSPSAHYLEALSDYLIFSMEKEEKKQKKIITENRQTTFSARETSFEGLVSKLENGEDGIYNMIANDKNIIFSPKTSITKEDVEEIPALANLKKAIEEMEALATRCSGKKLFEVKKAIIQLRQDQYVIKNAYKKPIFFLKVAKTLAKIALTDKITIQDNLPVNKGYISFFDPKHISMLLSAYGPLKEETYSSLTSDARWMLVDLENLIESALSAYPLYKAIVIYKIDGKTNNEIQELLQSEFGIYHSLEYISNLYRNKIPKIIAEQAQKEYLEWYFTFVEKGKWKKCTRCGQIKLAHNLFYSKNNSSKDGCYSICKECRNKKGV